MENTKRGGKRLGAGRKRGTTSIKAEEARKYLITEITKELKPIVMGQIEQAKGIYCEDEDKVVYQKQPDSKVAMYLLNQLVGHPKETLEVENKLDFAGSLRQLALDALERKKQIKLLEVGN